jgi:hypothetical protein
MRCIAQLTKTSLLFLQATVVAHCVRERKHKDYQGQTGAPAAADENDAATDSRPKQMVPRAVAVHTKDQHDEGAESKTHPSHFGPAWSA